MSMIVEVSGNDDGRREVMPFLHSSGCPRSCSCVSAKLIGCWFCGVVLLVPHATMADAVIRSTSASKPGDGGAAEGGVASGDNGEFQIVDTAGGPLVALLLGMCNRAACSYD